MHTGLMDWIGIGAVLGIGITVVAYGYFWDRARNRRRAEELREPPTRPSPVFDATAPAPNYLLASDLGEPPTMSPTEREEVRARLAAATDFAHGYCSADFASDNESGLAVLDRPFVMVVDGELSSVKQLLTALERALIKQRSLVVVAQAIEPAVLQTLAANHRARKLPTVALAVPEQDRKLLAALTNATQITTTDLTMDWVPEESMGRCARWVSDSHQSWIELD